MSVKLVWSTPNAEELLVYMARVSAPENQDKAPGSLINYLIRHEHWSPFEMVNLVIEINTTRDISRQILRHRSFSFQEFSQRYAAVDKLPEASLKECRMQDPKNRQSSFPSDDQEMQDWWSEAQLVIKNTTSGFYNQALKRGIAKEVARSILPEGLTPTRMYMNGTLRSWLHFLKLRSGNGSQKEIQELAGAIAGLVEPLFPVSWAALMNQEQT